jgi:hypothetical protein
MALVLSDDVGGMVRYRLILFRVLPTGTQFRAPETIRVRLLSGLVAPMRNDHTAHVVRHTGYSRSTIFIVSGRRRFSPT